jgi:transcriptional regulator with XRE-family HTH domain
MATQLAAQIRKAREATGLTQVEMAWKLGISPSTYCRYEQSRGEPRMKRLMAIAEATGQPLAFFVGQEEAVA